MNEQPLLTCKGFNKDSDFTNVLLSVSNYDKFPDTLFSAAPDLPPCGDNHNASRTWVNIYDGVTNAYIYGFAGLTSAIDLLDIWFAVPNSSNAPISVYIKMEDRKTSDVYLSNTLILVPDWITASNVVWLNESQSVPLSNHTLLVSGIVAGLLLQIAKALITKFVVDKVMNEVFPNENINFVQLRGEFDQIKNLVIDQTIQEEEGKINGSIDFMKIDYSNRKKHGANKPELYQMLSEHVYDLRSSIGILQRDLFKYNGFPTYLSCLDILICYYIEMAEQDPNGTNYTSSNISNLADTIIGCDSYIKQTKKSLIGERLAYITDIQMTWYFGIGIVGWFYDNYTGKRYAISHPKDRIICYDSIKQFRENYIADISSKLNWVDDLHSNWKNLFTTALFSNYNFGVKGYIPNSDDNTISVILTDTDLVIKTLNIGSYPIGVATTYDGTKVYVTSFKDGKVYVIDTISNTVVRSLDSGNMPTGIAVNTTGTKIYVSNCGGGNISVIDTCTNELKTISVGTRPQNIAINPDDSIIYITNTIINGNITIFDIKSEMVIANIPVGKYPLGVVVSPNGKYLYVTDYDSSLVYFIDTASNSIVNQIAVGHNPNGIAINKYGTKLYVANERDNTVSVINLSSNNCISTIKVGRRPTGVSFTPDGNKVFITNAESNSYSIIDTMRDVVINTVSIGNFPTGYGRFICNKLGG